MRRDVAQQACSKRSCEKKKSTLRNAKAELLQVMKELGCDYRGAFVGRPDHTGQIQECVPREPAAACTASLQRSECTQSRS